RVLLGPAGEPAVKAHGAALKAVLRHPDTALAPAQSSSTGTRRALGDGGSRGQRPAGLARRAAPGQGRAVRRQRGPVLARIRRRAPPRLSLRPGAGRNQLSALQDRQRAIEQELRRSRARWHVLTAVTGAVETVMAAGAHKAAVAVGAGRVEEDDAAPMLVQTHVGEQRNGWPRAEAADDGSRTAVGEVRRAVPLVDTCPQPIRWPVSDGSVVRSAAAERTEAESRSDGC